MIPRIGGALNRIGQVFTPDRLQGLAAIVADLDPNGGGNHFARYQHGRREDDERERKERAEAERRQRLAAAWQAANANGQFDMGAWVAAQTGEGDFPSIGEALAIQESRAPKPEKIMFGDINGDGVPDVFYESDGRAYLDANRGPGGFPAAAPRPGPPRGAAPPPPPEGFVLDRPTEAPATVGAAPQGFRNRAELEAFIGEQSPGARLTSGYRSQAQQDALRRRGVTRATRSSHTYGMGQDYVPNLPFDQWEAEAERLRRSGRFKRVVIERGGRNQGTGPHIHLEPY